MDKTININLGGTLFQIDEEAFSILRDYLQAINSTFANVQGGHETIEDIESRIAEIFQSQKGLTGMVSKENVEAMMTILGKPEDFDHGEPQQVAPPYTSHKKRMYRNTDDTIIGGVCSGMQLTLILILFFSGSSLCFLPCFSVRAFLFTWVYGSHSRRPELMLKKRKCMVIQFMKPEYMANKILRLTFQELRLTTRHIIALQR